MDVMRTAFIGLAYVFWVFGLVMLIGAVFSGATIFWTAVGLFIAGTVFYILNKVTQKR